MSRGFDTLTVESVEQLTRDAIAVQFARPSTPIEFLAGQYLTLRQTIDGEPVTRSYSLCAAPGEALRIGIKHIPGGLFSTFAHEHLRPGSVLESLPPDGSMTFVPTPGARRRYLLIAAGSGITPILSILRTILRDEPDSDVTLIFGNRSAASMMFRDELCALKNRYLARFMWLNLFSREDQDAPLLNGRIDNRLGVRLHQRLMDMRSFDAFYLCGPEAMISEVTRGLRGLEIESSRIRFELFLRSAEDARAVVARHEARARRYGDQLCSVSVTLDGRTSTFELATDGENILDGALDAGLEVPFSCRNGVCATCRARVLEGQVEMDLNHALEPAQLEQGMVLTCQAHPVTARVVLDYDV